MVAEYNSVPVEILKGSHKEIAVFSTAGENIDHKVVDGFGEEWLKFKDFDDEEIREIAADYFDILTPEMVNSKTYAADIGCGSGRWTKAPALRAGFVEAIDPSAEAISSFISTIIWNPGRVFIVR